MGDTLEILGHHIAMKPQVQGCQPPVLGLDRHGVALARFNCPEAERKRNCKMPDPSLNAEWRILQASQFSTRKETVRTPTIVWSSVPGHCEFSGPGFSRGLPRPVRDLLGSGTPALAHSYVPSPTSISLTADAGEGAPV